VLVEQHPDQQGERVAAGQAVGHVLAFPGVWLMIGSQAVPLVVSLSLVAACAVATVIALSLPWLVARLGRDPAFGSGPLATVVQDLLSLVIYFVVASAVLG
jgi:magnesium transporter